jgi:hypothetical protein
MAYENFTTFTEVDPNSKWTIDSATKVSTSQLPARDNSYVYKDYGVDYFGDFIHWFDFKTTVVNNVDLSPDVILWAVANQIGTFKSFGDYDLCINNIQGTTLRLRVYNVNYIDASGLSVGTLYYSSVQRSGTTLTLNIYSTLVLRSLGGTGDIASKSLTCSTSLKRYLYAGTGEAPTSACSSWISHYVENLDIHLPPTQQTINSNAQVSGKKNINSDAIVKQTEIQENISSDAYVIIRKYINSDATVKGTVQEEIDSNSKVVTRSTPSINSDATVKHIEQEEIDSDSKVVYRIQETIDSDAFIRFYKDFIFKHQLYSSNQKDFNLRLKLQYPTPNNPGGLTIADLETGEALYLTWTGTNFGWNVYKDVGGSWIKQNNTLITVNNYVVGSLVSGVTYLFKVVGVNGGGDESSGITISGTPTYDVTHYLKPTWKIYIGGIEQTDAVIERVELTYGPTLSSANFYIPKNPTTPGLPDANKQTVVIYINDKKVFNGYLMKKENVINAGDLRVSYTAVSKLWDYTKETVNHIFNEQSGDHVSSIDVRTILRDSSCPYEVLPSRFIYGEQNVADLTRLELMASMLRYVGNYKIYCDSEGQISYYKVGDPINIRTFEIGKHILNNNVTKDITDKVDQVTVLSDYIQYTNIYKYYTGGGRIWTTGVIGDRATLNDTIGKKDDGRIYMQKTIYGTNISNVKVEARVNSKPVVITTVPNIQISPSHCGLNLWSDGSSEGKFSIWQYQTFTPDWQTVSTEIDYSHYGSYATLTFPVPVVYYPRIGNYIATFKKPSGDISLGVSIFFEPYESIGDIRISYTHQGNRISYTIGSGTIKRTLYDGVAPYSINLPDESDSNLSDVNNYITERAQVEYDKLSKAIEGGSLTVLGDETIDLRTQVNGLEVMRVVHDFSNGFITNLDLTNEGFYHGEAVMRQKDKETTKAKTNKNNSDTRTIMQNLTQIKNVVGFLAEPTTSNNPKSGVGIYSD